MESIDITSNRLAEQGYNIKKEGPTMAIYFNGSCIRCNFYQTDWDKTVKVLQKKLDEDSPIDKLTIQEVLSCMAKNYPRLMNGHSSSSSPSSTTTTTAEGEEEAVEEAMTIQQPSTQPPTTIIELTPDLTKEISNDDLSEILSTSIKKDDAPKLITFNDMLLAQTNEDQFNIGFQAESAAGKSYIPIELSNYFPSSEIIKISSASPTAFFHTGGVWDDNRKAIICDLTHKIIILLDQPHFQLIERLRPILSHDDKELESWITDKTQKYGLRMKKVIIKGTPSFILCTARLDPDEQEKTRLLLLSPSTDQQKLIESLELSTLKKANPEEYERRIRQDSKRYWLTQRIYGIRQWGIREIILPNNGRTVFERFIKEHPHLKARHQRDFPRIFSFIKAHALLNCFSREKVKPDTVMATDVDIEAGFELYKKIESANELGLSPYIYKIYEDVIEPSLRDVLKDSDGEAVQGKTNQEILRKHYQVKHKPLSPDALKNILLQLESVGLIRLEQDKADRRKTVIYPTVTFHISQSTNKWVIDRYMEPNGGVESQKIFWQTYDALEDKTTTAHTITKSSFKASLIATGSFTASEAEQAIKEALEKGELTSPEHDVLCKKQP